MTIEKLKAIVKEKYGKELTDEQAAAYMEKHGKLTDNELDNVTGGCDGGGAGDAFGVRGVFNCPQCNSSHTDLNLAGNGKCYNCGHTWIE